MNYNEDESEYGYIIMADIIYPKKIHDSHLLPFLTIKYVN